MAPKTAPDEGHEARLQLLEAHVFGGADAAARNLPTVGLVGWRDEVEVRRREDKATLMRWLPLAAGGGIAQLWSWLGDWIKGAHKP